MYDQKKLLEDPSYRQGVKDALRECWRYSQEERDERRTRNCGAGYDAARSIQQDIERDLEKVK